METYTITPAKPADAAAILDYLKQLGGETDNLSFGAEGLPFTVAEEKAYLAARESTRDCLMLLVKQGGQIITPGPSGSMRNSAFKSSAPIRTFSASAASALTLI